MKRTGLPPYHFSFRRLRGGRVLLSNDEGANVTLGTADFSRFVSGGTPSKEAAARLARGGFVRDRLDLEGAVGALSERFFRGWRGPHVHIISLTAGCNLGCAYCSASASAAGRALMSRAVAAKTLDFIFSVPAEKVMIEFQGGEPLLNFKTLEFMVLEARRRAAAGKTGVNFSVVTNLGLMDGRKMRFLLDNAVTVCTSLDGPRELHDANRAGGGGSAHGAAVKWLRALVKRGRRTPGFEMPNAICTVTRAALPSARAIVDEYVRLGIMRVQLGPLEPLGRARPAWGRLGYRPQEFLEFYRSALEYMFELNRRGTAVYEKGALFFIKQILTGKRPRYQNLDLVYRLAYNWDGGVYGSDEARMLANSGDEFFRLGSVREDGFRDLLERPLARFLVSSSLNSLLQPSCARCPYSAYCGTAPVYNYIAQNSPPGNMAANAHCALYKGVLDMLFEFGRDKKIMAIFRKWDETYD